jgi:catechol 2,3-dioxygenase-like lactoylglutathione lyase family enzyme
VLITRSADSSEVMLLPPTNASLSEVSISAVHHVAIGIPDGAEPEARKFYCDLLGLEEVEKPDSLKDRGGFWLEVGGVQVHLQIDEPDRGRSRRHFGLVVDDADELRSRLENAGYALRDDVDIPGYSRFFVGDPWGNQVELLAAADRA